MILMWLLIRLLAWAQPGQGVYHEESASWFNLTFDHSDAFFGYSITYEPTSKRLIVSAPRASHIGEVYSCDIDAKTYQCTALPKTVGRLNTDYTHHLWFGATVKAGPSFFVTCAPLYTTKLDHLVINGTNKEKLFGTFSKCFKYSDLTKKPVHYSTMSSLTVSDRSQRATLFEHAMDSLGWSIDVDGDDVIVGGPAMFTGRAVKYNKQNKVANILNGFMNSKNLSDTARRVDYNFGYSVAVGHFSMKREKVYAIGSPYGKGGFGKVTFYTLSENRENLNGNSKKSKEDLQTKDAVGSMFGAVLCAATLTNDKTASTLLVGAPAYASSSQEFNRGAVYFYSPDKNLPLQNCYKKIVGKSDGGFFGSAIARLGDFNGDGMDEIAIAAPYENYGAGAVYIYSSTDVYYERSSQTYITNEMGEPTCIQRIVPSWNAGMVTSFGLSLAAVQDHDNNGCNELAIGAPEKNLVMFLKCIASVAVKVHTKIPKDLTLQGGVINPFRNENQFIFESCIDVDFPAKPEVINARINVSVQIDHKTAKLEEKEKWYEVALDRNQKVMCKNITVSAPKNGDYQRAIVYMIKATQLNPPDKMMKDFDASRVALNDRSKLTDSGNIWLIECKDKNNCKPDLKLNTGISVTPDLPYVLGSPERVKLNINVKNEGEAAYRACVHVNAAAGVTVAGVPTDCERPFSRYDGEVLTCKPRGALRNAEVWNITDIPFDLSSLNSEHKTTNISIVVDENCDHENVKSKVETIPLKPDLSNILVKGITDTGVSNALNMSKDEIEGKTFEHSYTITSAGLTTWVNVGVTIIRQNRSYIDYGLIYISSGDSLSDQCSVDPSNDTIFTCLIEKLNSKQSAKITVPMTIINPEQLDIAIKERQNTQYTSVTIALNDVETRSSSVTTTFNLGGQVNIWIIVVASLVGLLLLLLIFFVLRKYGFFEREKKMELENVRKSIRRQTVMRRTMMEGVRLPPGGDRRSLLASVPQETADQAAARDKRVRLDSNATRKK